MGIMERARHKWQIFFRFYGLSSQSRLFAIGTVRIILN